MQTTRKQIKHSASSPSANLVLVSAQGVPEVWPKVHRLITDACEYSSGLCSTRDVFDNLIAREWELWISMLFGDVVACGVTHMFKTHRTKAMVLKILAGSHWREHFERLQDVARRQGCERFMAECARPGWDREMPKLGFRKVHTLWELPLDVPA